MQFTVQKKDLSDALGRIRGIPLQKSMSNILEHVLLEAEDGRLTITALNYEVGVKVFVPCEIKEAGRMAVPARKLVGVVDQAPEGSLSFKSEKGDDWLRVGVKKFSVRMPTMNPDNLPPIQDVEENAVALMPEAMLIEIADKTSFAISVEESRPNLNGLYMKFSRASEPPSVEAVSTDGKRLSLVKRQITELNMDVEELGCLIHRKGIQEIKHFLKTDLDNVKMVIDRKGIRVERSDGFIVVRQIEMEFPNYDLVLPKDYQWSFTVSPLKLADTIKRVAIVATEGDRNPIITLKLEAGIMQVEAGDDEGGSAVDEIEVNYSGDPIVNRYNLRYILDALSAFYGSAEVEFRIKENAATKVIAGTGNEDVIQLIMPIKNRDK